MRGFGWKEILACEVEQGKYSLGVICCFSFGFFYYSSLLKLVASYLCKHCGDCLPVFQFGHLGLLQQAYFKAFFHLL